jgi:hypothetical protein
LKVTIRLPRKEDPVHIFIDADSDGGEGRDWIFNEGRIIPIYCYYPGERRGYILRSGGRQSGCIPNVEGSYNILLAVRGPEVERLEKGVRKLYDEVGMLEEIPQLFWPKLGTLTALRRFRVCMASELYIATQKACLLQEELQKEGLARGEQRDP